MRNTHADKVSAEAYDYSPYWDTNSPEVNLISGGGGRIRETRTLLLFTGNKSLGLRIAQTLTNEALNTFLTCVWD